VTEDTRPIAYVRGVAPFMGYEFFSAPGTMYPREVSAILVNTVVDLVRSGVLAPPPGRPLQVVDQCGGSANIGIVMAYMMPEAKVFSTDLMPVSSALARRCNRCRRSELPQAVLPKRPAMNAL